MGNEKNLELSEKLKKAYIGGHSNLKFDLSVTPMKIFVDRMEGARRILTHPNKGSIRYSTRP